jgi:dihydrofolate reductase
MDTGMTLSIVVAVSENRIIGHNGNIPWKLKRDLQRFKKITEHHTVIVGRKTHESIIQRLGHPLLNRRTIVVTHNPNFDASGCDCASSFEEALELAKNDGEVFVIGGETLYKAALPITKKVYLTKVHASVPGDTFFHPLKSNQWIKKSAERFDADTDNEHATTFIVLERNPIYVYLENARYDDQRRVMEHIQEKGLCPFCKDGIQNAELNPVLKEGKHWEIRENRWPYNNTRIHLLLIAKTHAEKLADLPSDAGNELLSFCKWAEQEFAIQGGAICFRFGSMQLSGSTVKHLHAHIIAADPVKAVRDTKRIQFAVGPKPHQTKEPPIST